MPLPRCAYSADWLAVGHGLVMTCAGARVKLAVRLAGSPLATRPPQPCTVKMCKFPPPLFTWWVRSL